MTIKTRNGLPLYLNGNISCECCEDETIQLNFAINSPEDCDCPSKRCFNPDDPEAPSASPTYTQGGSVLSNPFYPYANFIAGVYLQIPNSIANPALPGWTNIVSSPSVMRISGSIGGDIRIIVNETTVTPDPTFPQINTIIDEGEAPCGTCFTPRNGPHNINYTFPLKPDVILYFDLRSYVQCGGYINCEISRVGPYTPP